MKADSLQICEFCRQTIIRSIIAFQIEPYCRKCLHERLTIVAGPAKQTSQRTILMDHSGYGEVIDL